MVFEEIKKQRPKFLCIAADGPRDNQLNDIKLCAEAKSIIADIDWECQVDTLFRAKNLGSKYAVSEAITWFLNKYGYGIILEDDCLPNSSFFYFTESLLNKYQHDTNVMMITGCSFQNNTSSSATYYFSKYVHVWGWATWKRAWDLYNVSLVNEPEAAKSAIIKQTFKSRREQKLWDYNLSLINNGLDAWDYQWMYWIWKNRGLTIIPWQNMIANIGFGPDATHTFDESSNQSKMKQFELTQIVHPKEIKEDLKADNYERYQMLIMPFKKVILTKIISRAKRFFSLNKNAGN
ncbi:nucleotide-diphospho-sugar transferase [Pedobacter aquatilis]|uniref:nucleotide-diphospho-sugar transferase n=1 Tax=Pedobacter aquatilis TaxID=351343 RepID=UPI002930F7A1|nr:nucleotide-diphospho-sugar transferase [Pedobacter aquatilis]